MRKILIVVFTLALAFALTGCGGSDSAVVGINVPAPEFNGDNTDPAIINGANSQAIVDAAMSIGYVYMGVDEGMSFFGDNGERMDSIFNGVTASTGIINGCDGNEGGDATLYNGAAYVTDMKDYGTNAGGEMTVEFSNWSAYDPSSGVANEVCQTDGAIILSGFMNISAHEGTSSETGTIDLYGVHIFKPGVSNSTFDGSIVYSSNWNNTTGDNSESSTSSVKMTDNDGTAGTNETMWVNWAENSSLINSTHTDTSTMSGTLYTPADGIVSATTTIPIKEVSGTIEDGEVRLSSGAAYIDLLMDTEIYAGAMSNGTIIGGFFNIIQGY